jgi:hypothetical protein
MRKALLFFLLALLALALAQRYFTEEELKLIQAGGKAYVEVFVRASAPTRPSAPSTETASPPTFCRSSWRSNGL